MAQKRRPSSSKSGASGEKTAAKPKASSRSRSGTRTATPKRSSGQKGRRIASSKSGQQAAKKGKNIDAYLIENEPMAPDEQVTMNEQEGYYRRGRYRSLFKDLYLYVLFGFYAILMLSNFGLTGSFGDFLNGIMFGIMGSVAYVFPLILVAGTIIYIWQHYFGDPAKDRYMSGQFWGTIILVICVCFFIALIGYVKAEDGMTPLEYFRNSRTDRNGGGFLGGILTTVLVPSIGKAGAFLVDFLLLITSITLFTSKPPTRWLSEDYREMFIDYFSHRRDQEEEDTDNLDADEEAEEEEPYEEEPVERMIPISPRKRKKPDRTGVSPERRKAAKKIGGKDADDFKLYDLDFLDEEEPSASSNGQEEKKAKDTKAAGKSENNGKSEKQKKSVDTEPSDGLSIEIPVPELSKDKPLNPNIYNTGSLTPAHKAGRSAADSQSLPVKEGQKSDRRTRAKRNLQMGGFDLTPADRADLTSSDEMGEIHVSTYPESLSAGIYDTPQKSSYNQAIVPSAAAAGKKKEASSKQSTSSSAKRRSAQSLADLTALDNISLHTGMDELTELINESAELENPVPTSSAKSRRKGKSSAMGTVDFVMRPENSQRNSQQKERIFDYRENIIDDGEDMTDEEFVDYELSSGDYPDTPDESADYEEIESPESSRVSEEIEEIENAEDPYNIEEPYNIEDTEDIRNTEDTDDFYDFDLPVNAPSFGDFPEEEQAEETLEDEELPSPGLSGKAASHWARKERNPEQEEEDYEIPASFAGTYTESPAVLPAKKRAEKVTAADISAVAGQIEENEQKVPEQKYVFPPENLLDAPRGAGRRNPQDKTQELRETKEKLQDTLDVFGVDARVTDYSCGPAVTRFEIKPGPGVKVSRIVGLSDDIKLALAAPDIRIEAPIPGKSAVGIEVPNATSSTVSFRELIAAEEFRKAGSKITFAVGEDIAGKVVVTDIAKMPHLLIAGATGSGKSVCINTIIMSILYKAKPDEVKLIMIDPKVVELSVYNGIPHLLIPVVTDPKKAAGALQWAVQEMTTRYNLFAEAGVRDIKGYNAKMDQTSVSEEEKKKNRMYKIVIIVDELADLMMVASKDVEESICRLAQLARACGIHLIIATQRPSVNVITGLIKANMPSRIAFAVTSGIDSRTILDMNGAEKLLGKGDMLFSPQGAPKPRRIQGAFVSDDEVSRVVDFIKDNNGSPAENAEVTKQVNFMSSNTGPAAMGSAEPDDGTDPYFAEAGRILCDKEKASIGMLQRFLKVGFNRAARIMDALEQAGVVGPEEGTKPRTVLMTSEEFENYLRENT